MGQKVILQYLSNSSFFWPTQYLQDSSIKYLVNTDYRQAKSEYGSVENEIAQNANYWAPTLLSAWSFRLIILDVNASFFGLRLRLYKNLQRRFFNNPIKYSEGFLKQKTLLLRVSSILKKESLQRRFIHTGFPEFKNVFRPEVTFLKALQNNMSFLREESESLMNENQEILNASISAKVIKTNDRTQAIILLLTFVTTLIMIYDKRREIKELGCYLEVMDNCPATSPKMEGLNQNVRLEKNRDQKR